MSEANKSGRGPDIPVQPAPDAGMAASEFAVGTVGVVTLAGAFFSGLRPEVMPWLRSELAIFFADFLTIFGPRA